MRKHMGAYKCIYSQVNTQLHMWDCTRTYTGASAAMCTCTHTPKHRLGYCWENGFRGPMAAAVVPCLWLRHSHVDN